MLYIEGLRGGGNLLNRADLIAVADNQIINQHRWNGVVASDDLLGHIDDSKFLLPFYLGAEPASVLGMGILGAKVAGTIEKVAF